MKPIKDLKFGKETLSTEGSINMGNRCEISLKCMNNWKLWESNSSTRFFKLALKRPKDLMAQGEIF